MALPLSDTSYKVGGLALPLNQGPVHRQSQVYLCCAAGWTPAADISETEMATLDARVRFSPDEPWANARRLMDTFDPPCGSNCQQVLSDGLRNLGKGSRTANENGMFRRECADVDGSDVAAGTQ